MSEEYKGHVWYYRANRTAQPIQVEFPSPVTQAGARQRLAEQQGLAALPSDAVVSRRELEKLEPEPKEKVSETTPRELKPA